MRVLFEDQGEVAGPAARKPAADDIGFCSDGNVEFAGYRPPRLDPGSGGVQAVARVRSSPKRKGLTPSAVTVGVACSRFINALNG